MNTFSVDQLNEQFSFKYGNHFLRFTAGNGNIPNVEIKNEQASAIICLQGAHILSWIPTEGDEVIWMSKDATFAPGKSVRGGIPVCWPWFGAHDSNNSYPAHGFARTSVWQITDTRAISANETQITFKLDTHQLSRDSLNMWPLATVVEYQVTISKNLTLQLTSYNRSNESITIGQALHTYFKVADVSDTEVYGLDSKDYLDKTDGFTRKTQTGPVKINTEVDRVYLNTADDVTINDKKRKIIIKKLGSQSTVVWNPWKEVAEKMGDLGTNGYLNMICVESANAAEDTIRIKAGGSHKLQVIYSVEEF